MRPVDSPGQHLLILPQNKFGFSQSVTPDGGKLKLEMRSFQLHEILPAFYEQA
jgi:hypothetical protein